uniref:Uncharacterized protein n=1 Tax=Hyaloperonospora arabidopsidis (strain Emoy2) TaxID=559515 RepID=M4BH30_HYAAE
MTWTLFLRLVARGTDHVEVHGSECRVIQTAYDGVIERVEAQMTRELLHTEVSDLCVAVEAESHFGDLMTEDRLVRGRVHRGFRLCTAD